ncbi:MAG: hypothetical protein P8048_12180, partial [Calditrichia bacterium]
MKKFIILFVLLFFILHLACTDDVNKTEPPARVLLVPKTAESDTLEKGIDAVFDKANPLINDIILEWHPNTEKTLAGYSIYRSESIDKNYVSIGKITKNFNIIDTTFIDVSVSLDKRYFYFVKAFDELDQYGDPSDTVNYSVRESPVLLEPVGIIFNRAPYFSWNFHPNFVTDNFVFRLLIRDVTGVFKNFYTQETSLGDDYRPEQSRALDTLTPYSSLAPGTYKWR